MNPVTTILDRIKKDVPVEWDRYTNDRGMFNIYGWISRKDGQRDFVLIQALVTEEGMHANFVTSSAKYSKPIFDILNTQSKVHVDCVKVEELYK